MLAVVGLARVNRAADLARSALASACNRRYMLVTGRRFWHHSAPVVWPPAESYTSMRAIVRQQLPGARFRQHLFWRYSIVWVKPS